MSCRHFSVISPEVETSYSQWEPPEIFRCFVLVEADSARGALIAAVKDPGFREWVDQARGDGVPPFKGLEVSRCLCEHDVCWGCEECARCLAENDLNFEALSS